MKGRDPYQLALGALTRAIGEGQVGWGEPLVVTAVAEDLRLSPTPVREALARLAGEGIVEHHPGRGYFAPRPTAQDITELYGLHLRLCRWALERRLEPVGPATRVDDQLDPIEAVFLALVDAAGDRVLSRTMRRTSLQLRPLRRLEARLELSGAAQVEALGRLHAAARRQPLADAVEAYHEGRFAQADRLFQMIRQQAKI